MSFKRMLFKGCVLMLSLIVPVLTGCVFEKADDSVNPGDGLVLPDDPLVPDDPLLNPEIEYVYLETADNLLVGDNDISNIPPAPSSLSRVVFSVTDIHDSGLRTMNTSGDIKAVNMKGGNQKKLQKALKITRKDKNSSRVKAAFIVRDESTDIREWHLIDKNDKAHKLRRQPLQKGYNPDYTPRYSMSRLKNAPAFHEHDKIYYLDVSHDLLELDLSDDVSYDQYTIVRSGVEQAVMDVDGNWMLELTNGQVKHLDASGNVETRLNDGSLNNNAEVNKFFMAQGRGFIYFGESWCSFIGVFFRTFIDQGQVQVVSAQVNKIPDCTDGDSTTLCPILYFYPHYTPDLCSYQAVAGEELLLCNNGYGYVYNLGDASHDMEQIDFNWAGQGGGKAVANADFLYYYSNEPVYNGSRLTRIDVASSTCMHLFSRDNTPTCGAAIANYQEYIIDHIDHLTVSADNIVRFCGHRVSGIADDREEDPQLLLVEITGADTATPQFRETAISDCKQLSNL